MRKLIVSSSLAIIALCAASSSAHAQLKVGTLDMNQIFVNYYKTKQAEATLNGERNDAKKDLDDRIAAINKAMEDIKKLNDDVEKKELSADGRAAAKKNLEDKVAQARALDRDAADFRQKKDQELNAKYMRMRNDIIKDIMEVVNDKVKAGGYDLLLDKSGLSIGQIPVVLYSRADMDFSNDIVATLNKNAPKPSSAAN